MSAPDPFALAADVLDPPEVDVFSALGYEPETPQRLFHDAVEFDVGYGGRAGGGKELRCDEPIPTPDGWTTMGDLVAGDIVFAETGVPCTVLAAHPVDLRPTAYRLTFDDGSTIECDADHRWLTFTAKELAALSRRTDEFRGHRRAARPSRATGRRSELFNATITARNQTMPPASLDAPAGAVRTTKEIAETLVAPRGRRNHAMPVAAALELPDAELPLDPYVLGAWLGDGSSANAGFTSADPEILDEIRAAGVTVTDCRTDDKPYAYRLGDTITTARAGGRPGRVNTFAAILRSLGVAGNKHVPPAYLRVSKAQRLALLQGLMDTDGTVCASGSVEFTNTNQRLVDAVYELIVSLGWKARVVEGRAMLEGRDCGPVWSIKWTPSEHVFRLARKSDRQRLATRRVTRFRYVVAAELVDPEPMRCITVDNPTGLFLAGRSMLVTHNSLALLMEGIQRCKALPGFRVGAFRRSFDELDESLLMHLKARLEEIEALGAKYVSTPYPELRFANGSIMRFRYAETMADASRRYGGEYQMLLIDERQQIAPPVVDLLTTRLRSGNPSLPVLGIRSTFNPGDVGHTHLKERYVLGTKMGTETYDEVVADVATGKRVRFIPAPLSKHVDPGYVGVLSGIPDTQLRRALLEGDWDALTGQAFEEWRYDLHVIPPASLDVPLGAGVARAQGLDWGMDHPFVCLWGAIVNEQIVVYREVTGRQLTPTQQAEVILAAEAPGERKRGRPMRAALDPSAFAGYPDSPRPTRRDMPPAKSIASDYTAAGVPVHMAYNDRIGGKRLIHEALRIRPDGRPGLVISSECRELVRTLPAMMRDPKRPEDVKKVAGSLGSDGKWHGGDDCYDALRYLVAELRGKSPPATSTERRRGRARQDTAGLEARRF